MKARPAELLPLIPVIGAGIFFRLYQLPGQLLVDDEWHAIHKILMSSGYQGVFTDFGLADHCIPLTLLYMFLLKHLWLSEMLMRLPSIAAGFLALLAVFLLAGRIVGRRAALTAAALLSISPLHVFYSRLARPYALSMLLSFIAVLAFYFWWTKQGRGWLPAYLCCGILSVWLLLPSFPLVAGPFGFAMLHSFLERDPMRGFRRLLPPGIMFGAGLLLLLGPPLLSNFGAIGGKVGEGRISLWSVTMSCRLFGGTAHLWLLSAVGCLCLAGLVLLYRKNRGFALYSLFLVVCQIAGFVAANPLGSDAPILLNRYSIGILPFLLIWAALPLAVETGNRVMKATAGTSFIALSLLLLVFGPFRDIYFYPNHFTNYGGYQMRYDLSAWLKRARPPEPPVFYNELAGLGNGKVTLLEAPWHYNDNILAYYEWVHRQHVYVGFVAGLEGTFRTGEVPAGDSRFRFRNFMHVSDFRRIEEKGIDYVVFHRNLEEERPSGISVFVADVSGWIDVYMKRYGNPVYEDRFLTVFRVSPQQDR